MGQNKLTWDNFQCCTNPKKKFVHSWASHTLREPATDTQEGLDWGNRFKLLNNTFC